MVKHAFALATYSRGFLHELTPRLLLSSCYDEMRKGREMHTSSIVAGRKWPMGLYYCIMNRAHCCSREIPLSREDDDDFNNVLANSSFVQHGKALLHYKKEKRQRLD